MSEANLKSSDYPELLADMADQAEKLLVQMELPPADAKRIAFEVAEFMREHWGGQLVYIAKGANFETRKRWKEIWEQFDGRNHAELARKFKLGLAQIYKITEIMRRAEMRKNQGDLFGGEAA